MLELLIPNEKNNFKPYMLRNTALVIYTVFLLLFNTLSGLIGLDTVHASSITATNIVSLTNVERTKYGLNTLKVNSKLSSAALSKANNMFKEQYWNHFGPNGETPWQFIKQAGYTYVYAGENLAKGFESSEGVVDAWMASPTHRDNILSGNYKEIGVAVVSGRLLGEETILVVQMFGNQTNDTTPTPKPNVPNQNNEGGQTMSIKITSPKNGSIINDPKIDISGTTSNINSKYTVTLSDEGKVLGGFETNGTSWSYDKKSDWSEGTHEVTASVVGKEGISDKTKFTIDSTGPTISDLKVEKDGTRWNILGTINENNGSINLIIDDTTKSLEVNDKGEFSGEVLYSSQNMYLLASDSLGNITQKDISDYFNEGGTVMGSFINFVNSIDIKDAVNGTFLGFMLILMLIEVGTLAKKRMLAKRSAGILTLGAWWIILCIGVIGGFSGVVN